MTASFDYRLDAASTLSFGLGAATSGLVIAAGQRHDILPGLLVSASFSRRLFEGRGALPFVLFSVTGGVSVAQIRPAPSTIALYSEASGFHAIDLRAGLTVGKTFEGVLTPYAAIRAFGGPVFWQRAGTTIMGGDQYHYVLATGLVASLPKGFDLFGEIAPLGERSFTVGGGRAF